MVVVDVAQLSVRDDSACEACAIQPAEILEEGVSRELLGESCCNPHGIFLASMGVSSPRNLSFIEQFDAGVSNGCAASNLAATTS